MLAKIPGFLTTAICTMVMPLKCMGGFPSTSDDDPYQIFSFLPRPQPYLLFSVGKKKQKKTNKSTHQNADNSHYQPSAQWQQLSKSKPKRW